MSITNSHITPLVSVIIPTFNRAKIITRALIASSRQTLENYEVIIVDDGSTDDLGFIQNYRGLNRVRVIRHSKNRGASAARNTGIVAAVGEFVAFLDLDDCWYPDKLACQVTSLRSATRK